MKLPPSLHHPSILLVALLAITASALHAQSPSASPEPPPEPPLVLPAPSKVQWTIAYDWTGANAPRATDGARLISTTVTKIENKRREVSRWGDGRQSERWVVDGLAMTQQPTWPPEMVVSEPAPPGEGDFDLGWLDVKYFQKSVTLEGKKCYYYVGPDRAGENRGLKGDGGEGPPMIKVWIDEKTRLPILVQTAECRKHYAYANSTETALQLPATFARRYDLYLASRPSPAPAGR